MLIAATGDTEEGNDVLRNLIKLSNTCTFGKYDFMKKKVADFEMAMLAIRSKSVSESVELGYRCLNTVVNEDGVETTCNHRNFIDIPFMEKVKFKPEPDPIVKITDTIAIKLIPITMEDVINNLDLDDPAQFRTKVEWISEGENLYTEFSVEEFSAWCTKIPVEPAEKIVKYFNEQSMAYLQHPVTCKKCKHKSEITIEGATNFFG